MNAKPIRKSKTVWMNVATGVGLFALFLLPQLDALPMSEDVRVWLVFGVACINALANIVVRLYTHAPLQGTKGELKSMGLK